MRGCTTLLVAVIGLVLVGCRGGARPGEATISENRAVSLRGTYGVAQGAVIEPVLKVEETKTGYAFTERRVGEWMADPETPHVATEDEVKRALGVEGVGFRVFGLVTNRAFLLKGPAGWRNVTRASGQGGAPREVVSKSGYLLVSGGELVPAQKIEMGGR